MSRFLLDLDRLEANIRRYQQVCDRHGKTLLPMTKTHKCSEILRLQLEAGCAGVLVGTVEEAEVFAARCEALRSVVFPYPLVTEEAVGRVLALPQRVAATLSVDTLEGARLVSDILVRRGRRLDALLIVDVGLDRLGVPPEEAGALAARISAECPGLNLVGVSSHPGQVYRAMGRGEVEACCREELERLRRAKASFLGAGLERCVVHSGSTPTFLSEAASDVVDVLRPGNYVFHDAIQVALGVCAEEDCALTVAATVISDRGDGRYVMDCGSKCLGLDKGAHGNAAITGYGTVLGVPGASILSLSEEVGVVESVQTPLSLGRSLRILPNHSCSAANMTSRFTALRAGRPVSTLEVDARENTR